MSALATAPPAQWDLVEAPGPLAVPEAPAPLARAPFHPKRITLATPAALQQALAALRNAPLDAVKPLEFVLQEFVEARGPDANALMWSGPLRDISEQAWVEDLARPGQKRRYRPECWHDYFKRAFLPEAFTEGITRKEYRKWAFAPDNQPVLVGSTKKLTKRGFALYLTEVEAFGANLGVQYHASPQMLGRSR